MVAPAGNAVSTYDEAYFASGGYRSYFERAPQWRYEACRRLAWLLPHARPRRLLEVGCAGGFFVAHARELGIDAEGVELSAAAAEYAKRRLGIPVTLGAFEETELIDGFDAVCAFHVLEHAPNAHRFLEKAYAVLVPGGWLALEVPNVESARARREGELWFGHQPDYHVYNFSPRALAEVVAEAGFALVHCDTIFPRHYFRPSRTVSPPGLANLFQDWRAARTLRTVHASLGDHIRLLARHP